MTEFKEHRRVSRMPYDVTPVFHIARNEFSMLMDRPLTLIVASVILAIAVIHAAGDSIILPQAAALFPPGNVFITMGMDNSYWYTTLFLSFLALCVGVVSMSEERSGGSIRVLLTKPLYRRDIIAGKFLGDIFFMFCAVAASLLVCIASMLITCRGALPYSELLVRTGLYCVVLSIYCSITLGIAMLMGSFFKDRGAALIASFCYLYFALIETSYFNDLGSFCKIDPYFLYFSAFSPADKTLFDMSGTVASWLSLAMPYIALLLLEVIIVFLLNSVVFNREEA